MKSNRKSLFLIIALAAVISLAAAWPCAAQTTWTVTSTADDGSLGTLRYALASALDGDTINFELSTPATIALASGVLIVDKSVTITGPGQDLLTVDGHHASRVFSIYAGKTVTISGLTIANGSAADKLTQGGGVYNAGTLTIRDCALRGNVADYRGGGVANYYGATLTVTGCTLSGNSVSGSYGLLGGGGAISSSYNTTVTIESSTMTENNALNGGAIAIIVSCGDIAQVYQGILTVVNSTLSDNSASGDLYSLGGGIFVYASCAGRPSEEAIAKVTVENSTLRGNSVSGSQAAYGGGIAGNAYYGIVMLTVKNSTLSGNSATTAISNGNGIGGAIATFNYLYGYGALTVDNSTLSGNWDDGVAGGIWNGISHLPGTTAMSIKNTILNAGPAGANLANDSSFKSYGYNLCSDDGAGLLTDPTDRINTNPMLGPLADNGGPTFTHALLAGSPAIDTGSSTDIAGNTVTTDQRGIVRPQGLGYDIGAFELLYSWSGVLPPVNPDGTSVFRAGSTVPVKFMITGWSVGITDLAATLSYAKISNGTPGPINESDSTAAATSGNLFRYDPTAGQYIFNWSTKGLSPGTYRLFIDLGDGVERTLDLGLK